jgi:hypothetical protein
MYFNNENHYHTFGFYAFSEALAMFFCKLDKFATQGCPVDALTSITYTNLDASREEFNG